ncbi:MAG: hypothetical protein DCC52_14995 [Chloroflexi bacterium]|nr:MAG: hypothetical protein DCC52_14995 [Chloroflexota bacterium]
MFSKFFKKAEKTTEPAQVYMGLRNQILNLKPSAAGIEPSSAMPNVWGILMETGYPQAVATLVSLADGTTSLYFSNGGGMIGGGQHATVARASVAFIQAAEKYYPKMTPTQGFPSPAVGRVKFYVLTYSGAYTIDIGENDLGNKRHELSPLFYYGQEVITQFRQIQTQQK